MYDRWVGCSPDTEAASQLDPAGLSSSSPLLPASDQVRAVTLPNGLTVWVQRHPWPPGHVALGLHLAVGSLCEEEDERGYAHFLEHMAFAGTRRFAPEEMTAFFASLGTTLGHHHNATTTLESTRFTLLLPSTAQPVLRRALALLADFAFGLTLPAPEVERQRAIILEEMRARVDPAARTQEALLRALVPGSRVARRHPLGSRTSVRAASRSRLEEFYRRWYRPSLATLAVVGDVPVAEVLQEVEGAFAPWREDGVAPRPPEPGVAASGELRAVALRSRALAHVQVSHRAVHPDPPPHTERDLAGRWAARLAWWMLNRRLAHRLERGELPGEEVHLSSSPLVAGWAVTRAVAAAPRGRAGALLEPMLVELQRARQHGFHHLEVEAAGTVLRRAFEEASQGYPRRPAAAVLTDLLTAAPRRRPPLAPSQRHALAEKLIPALDGGAAWRAFLAALPANTGILAAVVPARRGLPTPAEAELLAAHRRAAAAQPPPSLDLPTTRLPLLRPPPGVVVARRERAAPAVTTLHFANRAVVHLAEMRQHPGRVFLTLTLAGGRIREREGCLGITHAALLAAQYPAAAGIAPGAIADVLARHSVSLAASAEEDCVTVSVACASEDLQAALEVVHALLTSARLSPLALRHWREAMRRVEHDNARNLEAQLAQAAAALLSGGDPRLRLLTYADARAISWRAAQRWLDEEICAAPLEAAIVGDLEPDRAAELAALYLGSLPPRPDRRAQLDALRSPAGPASKRTVELQVPGGEDRGALLVGWRAAPWGDRRTRHRLKVAEYLLAQRLLDELRQRRRLTYSVQCSFSPSKAYPALSLLAVACLLPPARLDEAAAATLETVGELATHGPRPDELEAVRTFLVRAAGRAAADPGKLSRLLAEAEYRGVDIAHLARLDEDYLTADASSIGEVLRITCTPAKAITVRARPQR